MLIKKLLLIILSLLLLVSLEAVSYFLIPDAKLNELESILRILEADSQLIWRQRPYLNTRFQGTNITTNFLGIRNNEVTLKKENNYHRIICLGPSSTFGWGVENEKAYSYLLEKIIKSEYTDFQDAEVINAGVIGYSSFQGKIFLKKNILQLKPDMIIVSYLINDIDKYRFYRSNGEADKDLAEGNRSLIYLENIFGKSRLYTALKRVIFFFKDKNPEYGGGIYFENRRVSEADYSINLNEIIDIAEANNIKVVFINTPIGRINNSAIKNAKVYLQKAKEMELLECVRLSKVYNDIISRVASERNIPLVDAVFAFDEFTQKTGLSLFINPAQDFVHPNIEGHRIISQEIYKILLKFKLLPSSSRVLTGQE